MNNYEWSLFLEERLIRPPLVRCRHKAAYDTGWSIGPWESPEPWREKLVGWDGQVGMLTGRGLLVVDVDLYKPGAQDSLDLLVDKGLSLETVTAITPRGGRHLYYRYDPDVYRYLPSRSLEPLGFPGVDVKCDGGMVIVPPSVKE